MNNHLKYKVLVITRSELICHIFHIIASYFQWFTFSVADNAEVGYMMFQEEQFDLALIEPYGFYTLEIDEDIMAVAEEIKNSSSIPIVYLGPTEIPNVIKAIFHEKVIFPFDRKQLESALNRALQLAFGSSAMQSASAAPARERS